jgi:quinol monooxygenase YgiN
MMSTMRTTPVRMIVTWRAHPGEAASIIAAMQPIMVRTRSAPGCIACSLSTRIEGHVEICYIADWDVEAALQRQIRSRDFVQLAELIEHATEHPTIEFLLPDGIRGLEYAEKVRARTRPSDSLA